MRVQQATWLAVVMALVSVVPAAAQSGTLEVGGQVAVVRSTEFDANDLGLGGRVSWLPGMFGIEGELNWFPRGFPDDRPFSRARVEGLFGITAGPRIGALRPFVRVRPGFVTVRASEEPLACILIFPPPLTCTLAGGRTLMAFDLGGGMSIDVSPRASWRVDVGDRMVRYPGPAFRDGGRVQDESFFGHDVRVATGLGVRF